MSGVRYCRQARSPYRARWNTGVDPNAHLDRNGVVLPRRGTRRDRVCLLLETHLGVGHERERDPPAKASRSWVEHGPERRAHRPPEHFRRTSAPHRLLDRSVRAGISRRPQAIRHRLRRNPKERQVEINRDAYTVRRAGSGPHAAGMRKRSRRRKPQDRRSMFRVAAEATPKSTSAVLRYSQAQITPKADAPRLTSS